MMFVSLNPTFDVFELIVDKPVKQSGNSFGLFSPANVYFHRIKEHAMFGLF